MTPKKYTILIAGASGVVGAAAVDHFASLPDWPGPGKARRPPKNPPGRGPLAPGLAKQPPAWGKGPAHEG